MFGGARIAHSLMHHRLIDEYRLTIHPHRRLRRAGAQADLSALSAAR